MPAPAETREVSALRAWFGPMLGLVLVLVVTAELLTRGVNRYDNYDAAYSRIAITVAVLPLLAATTLLVKLGRDRARGRASRLLTAAAVVGVVVAVPTALLGITMFGVH